MAFPPIYSRIQVNWFLACPNALNVNPWPTPGRRMATMWTARGAHLLAEEDRRRIKWVHRRFRFDLGNNFRYFRGFIDDLSISSSALIESCMSCCNKAGAFAWRSQTDRAEGWRLNLISTGKYRNLWPGQPKYTNPPFIILLFVPLTSSWLNMTLMDILLRVKERKLFAQQRA